MRLGIRIERPTTLRNEGEAAERLRDEGMP